MADLTGAPEVFSRAVTSLGSVQPRQEIQFDPIPAPQRLALWAYAWGLELTGEGQADASGRLVLLHEPDGHEAWGGTWRLVGFIRADLDADLAGDPMLSGVSWSWLTESLRNCNAQYIHLGGTVTQTSSVRFGAIAGPERVDELELRASWTPVGDDFQAHASAFCELIASAAGLPPVGVVALGKQRS